MSKVLRCSFCDSKQAGVEVLIKSPTLRGKTAHICNGCVETCNQIIALRRHGKVCLSCQMSIEEIESNREKTS